MSLLETACNPNYCLSLRGKIRKDLSQMSMISIL